MNIWKSLLQYIFSSLIMTIIIFFISKIINQSFLKLLIGIVVGILVYLLCLQLFKNAYFISTKQEIIMKIKTNIHKINR